MAPWRTYQALERSRSLPRPDDTETWSVVCFFIDSRYRCSGLTRLLLDGAVAYAVDIGAPGVEGYPVELGPRSYTYMGAPSRTSKAGPSRSAQLHVHGGALDLRRLRVRQRDPAWLLAYRRAPDVAADAAG